MFMPWFFVLQCLSNLASVSRIHRPPLEHTSIFHGLFYNESSVT